jgi:hypothetical protein
LRSQSQPRESIVSISVIWNSNNEKEHKRDDLTNTHRDPSLIQPNVTISLSYPVYTNL